jgi:putative addiction module killer protein
VDESLTKVEFYQDRDGKEPFSTWFEGIRDSKTRRKIISRFKKVEQGNYGDVKPIGKGLSELRFSGGPGYRIYFGVGTVNIVVILCAGDKGSQSQDIKDAKDYWQDYKSNEEA